MENLQEKLEAIAVYDGWCKQLRIDMDNDRNGYSFFHDKWGGNVLGEPTRVRVRDSQIKKDFRYLTSLDWLHPVAMKVRVDLKELRKAVAYGLLQKIDSSCCLPPNSNGEYTDLFNAVYDGIQFINQYKK